MKKLIMLLIYLMSINISAQSNSISISTELDPYVEEFVSEALERGFYVRGLLVKKIDYIVINPYLGTSKGDNRLGVVGKDYRGFYVSPTVLSNPIKLKITIFHEIGHILKKSGAHTCNSCYDIMSAYSPIDLSYYENESYWEEVLDIYF